MDSLARMRRMLDPGPNQLCSVRVHTGSLSGHDDPLLLRGGIVISRVAH